MHRIGLLQMSYINLRSITMKNAILFILGVAISSVAVANLYGSNEPVGATAVKAEVILGHRIGSNGQEILVTK